jgi:hypothetical protein
VIGRAVVVAAEAQAEDIVERVALQYRRTNDSTAYRHAAATRSPWGDRATLQSVAHERVGESRQRGGAQVGRCAADIRVERGAVFRD